MDHKTKMYVTEMMFAWLEQAIADNALPAILFLKSPAGDIAYTTPEYLGKALEMESADGTHFKKLVSLPDKI